MKNLFDLDLKLLIRSKTFWTGVAGIASGVALIVNDQKADGIQTIIGGLGLIFIRQGIASK